MIFTYTSIHIVLMCIFKNVTYIESQQLRQYVKMYVLMCNIHILYTYTTLEYA